MRLINELTKYLSQPGYSTAIAFLSLLLSIISLWLSDHRARQALRSSIAERAVSDISSSILKWEDVARRLPVSSADILNELEPFSVTNLRLAIGNTELIRWVHSFENATVQVSASRTNWDTVEYYMDYIAENGSSLRNALELELIKRHGTLRQKISAIWFNWLGEHSLIEEILMMIIDAYKAIPGIKFTFYWLVSAGILMTLAYMSSYRLALRRHILIVSILFDFPLVVYFLFQYWKYRRPE